MEQTLSFYEERKKERKKEERKKEERKKETSSKQAVSRGIRVVFAILRPIPKGLRTKRYGASGSFALSGDNWWNNPMALYNLGPMAL